MNGTRASAAGGRSSDRDSLGSRLRLTNAGWIVVLSALGLSLIGLEAIGTTEPALAYRQAGFLVVGVFLAVILALPSYRWAERLAWPIYLTTFALLVLVLLPGVPDVLVHPRNGARRWINAGFTQLQPSEIAKLAMILVVASWLRGTDRHRTFPGLAFPFLLALVPAFLILVEPDLGTALLFGPTLLAMVIAAGAKKRHMAAIVLGAVLVAPLSYPFLRPHQKGRVDALIAQVRGDDRYARTIGFQGGRAMTLVGAGGLLGQGEERAGSLVHHNALPEEHNDMVFAVVCCRWGMVGGAVVWILSMAFSGGGLLVAWSCRDPFGRLVATGISAMLFTQMAVNTGMTIGVLPITGITLPFISYGGTSLLACWAMTGLVFAMSSQSRRMFERASFEYGGA
ncbi:MAG: rod shape-determining protein RodA [Phycisphaerales bacterium]|nr:rod shape-determining protein RodA [Phycisphaerales bacterium]